MPSEDHAEPVIEARFLSHEEKGKKPKWQAATVRRVVAPSLNPNQPYVLLTEKRTGASRSRPLHLVEVEVVGSRGGRRWAPITNTELAGGGLPLDARPEAKKDTDA